MLFSLTHLSCPSEHTQARGTRLHRHLDVQSRALELDVGLREEPRPACSEGSSPDLQQQIVLGLLALQVGLPIIQREDSTVRSLWP